MYSDGLVERRGESIDVGIARLVAAVADLPATLDPDDACRELVDRLLATGPGSEEARDDVALVVVELSVSPRDATSIRRAGAPTRNREGIVATPPSGAPHRCALVYGHGTSRSSMPVISMSRVTMLDAATMSRSPPASRTSSRGDEDGPQPGRVHVVDTRQVEMHAGDVTHSAERRAQRSARLEIDLPGHRHGRGAGVHGRPRSPAGWTCFPSSSPHGDSPRLFDLRA